MVDQELSFEIENVWIERRIAVQLDSGGQKFLEYYARTKVLAKDVEGVIRMKIPSSVRPLWDLLYMRDRYADFIIGVDCEDQIKGRRYAETVADGEDTDGMQWTVCTEDTPVTDPPIPVQLVQTT